jgi:hypothetical protein
MIIISGMWVGLIPMNISPLDPSLLWNHSPPLFSSLSYRNQRLLLLLIISMYIIHSLALNHINQYGLFAPTYRLTSLIHIYTITL